MSDNVSDTVTGARGLVTNGGGVRGSSGDSQAKVGVKEGQQGDAGAVGRTGQKQGKAGHNRAGPNGTDSSAGTSVCGGYWLAWSKGWWKVG